MSFFPPGYCPNCGDYVEEGAESCECCGSCPKTGWNEDSVYDGLDLPEEEFESSRKVESNHLWRMIGVAVLIVVIAYVFIFR